MTATVLTLAPEWRDDLDDTLVCVAVHDVSGWRARAAEA